MDFADNVLRFSIPPQWEKGDNDLRVEGNLDGDRLSWLDDGPSWEVDCMDREPCARTAPQFASGMGCTDSPAGWR